MTNCFVCLTLGRCRIVSIPTDTTKTTEVPYLTCVHALASSYNERNIGCGRCSVQRHAGTVVCVYI